MRPLNRQLRYYYFQSTTTTTTTTTTTSTTNSTHVQWWRGVQTVRPCAMVSIDADTPMH